jgi:hypothetical protein
MGSLTLVTVSGKNEDSNVSISAWQESYATLLSRYVTPAGVRYAAWKKNTEDMAALRSITDQLAQAKPPKGSKAKLAFYLDAYNAIVLHSVLAVYPITGVLEHDAEFFKRSVTLCGESITLDYLENEIIRKQFKEPRIHFALNCASVSCPPLLAKPYASSDLEMVLEAQTKSYLNSAEGSSDEGVVSQLFEWFAVDFEKAEGSVLKFINKHRDTPLSGTSLTFRPYNWNLNQAP